MPYILLNQRRLTARSEWLVFDDADLQIWLPPGWHYTRQEQEDLHQAVSPDQSTILVATLIPGALLAQDWLLGQIRDMLQDAVENLHLQTPESAQVNGLATTIIRGKGTTGGSAMNVLNYWVEHKHHTLLLLAMNGREGKEGYVRELTAAMGSVSVCG